MKKKYFSGARPAAAGLFCLLLLGLIIASSGCRKPQPGAGGEKTVVLVVSTWSSNTEEKSLDDSLKKFQENNPGISVKVEQTPMQAYSAKVLTEIAGGSGPDLIRVEQGNFISFCSKGALLDLMPLIRQDRKFNLNDYFPKIVDRFTLHGKLYSLPMDISPMVPVFYNKSAFEKAGLPFPTDNWSWDNLLSAAEKLTVRDKMGKTVQYGLAAPWLNFVYSNGGSFVDNVEAPTRCTFDSPEVKQALQFYNDIINKYKAALSENQLTMSGQSAEQLFMAGKIAMFNAGPWDIVQFREIKSFDWDIFAFPKGPRGTRGVGSGGSGMGILSTTKHPQEAWKLAEWLSTDWAKSLAETGIAQPANIKLYREWVKSPDKPHNKAILMDAAGYAEFFPNLPGWSKIWPGVFDKYLFKYFFEKQHISIDEALKQIAAEVNETGFGSDRQKENSR